VDTVLFNPDKKNAPEDVYAGLERPIWVNVGRVAVEKNLTAFLDLDLPGTKVIVGDGPQLAELKRHYSDVLFTGAKFDTELARYFADADVFVFPSKTDTFGLVIIEAMASGLPVAAYPVSGPVDIIPGSKALLTPQYRPRKRWRRVRRLTRIASSPYHAFKKYSRKVMQALRGLR